MTIFHWHNKPTPSRPKTWEIDFAAWGFDRGINLITLEANINRRTDHGGFYFNLTLFNVKLEINYADHRHWNDEEDRYETKEEEMEEDTRNRTKSK